MSNLPIGRALIYLAVAGATWGTTGAAVDLIYRQSDLGPVAVSFWRYVGGVTLLLVALRIRRKPALRAAHGGERRRRWTLRVGSGLGLAVFQTGYFASVQATGVAVSTVVTLGAAPMLAALGGRFFLYERIGRGGLLALAGTVGGLGVLVLGNQPGVVHADGVAFALLSATGFAGTTLLTRRIGRRESPESLTAWAFGIGAVVLLPFALGEGLLPQAGDLAYAGLLLAYVAAVPTALAYPLYFAGATAVRATTATMLMLIEPVSAAVIAVAFLGESLTAATLIGAVMLLLAVAWLAVAETA